MFTILQNNTINDLVSHHYGKHLEQKLWVKILFKSLSDTAHRAGRFKQHLGEVLCIGMFKSQWRERGETIFYAQVEVKSVNIPSDT